MKKFIYLINLLLFFSFNIIHSQSAISGTVIDGEFSDPLPFANIILYSSNSNSQLGGTSSDFDGKFLFEVSEGEYSVEFSFVGYETKRIEKVIVGSQDEVELNSVLFPTSNSLEEVVVTTTARKNNESSVLAIQKKSVNLIDGLSATAVRKTGDSDIASAIKRVPGVSIQGGKFVYVRGLGDRYSKTLLGGMQVPGLDPDKNTLQLDIFPTSLLENIIVNKSASANLGADFTGGIVDVILRDFSSIPEYNLTVSAGYNSTTNFKDAPSLPDYSLNGFSFDSGQNNLPFDPTIDIPIPESFLDVNDANLLNSTTNSFTKQLGVSRNNNLMDYNVGITASNQFKLGEKSRIGFISSINYKYDSDYYKEIFNGLISKEPQGLEEFSTQKGELGSIQAIASGLFGLSLKSNKMKHNIVLLTVKSGESNAIDGFLRDFLENPYLGVANIMSHTERKIMTVPISGKYTIGSKLNFNWKVAPSKAEVKDIDFRKTVFNLKSNGAYLIDNSTTNNPTRLWRNLDEKSLSSKFDLELNTSFASLENKLMVGFAFDSKSRDFSTDNYQIAFLGRSSNLNGDFNAILDSSNVWNIDNPDYGSYVLGSFQRTNQYESSSRNLAYYVSSELKFSNKFKSILGLRYENYSTKYTGENIERTKFKNEEFIDVADFYPSLNLIFSINESTNVRGSFSKTTARPSFRENSTAQIYDPITERFFLGNQNLKPTYIDNFDIRYEKFGNGNELTAVSVFYKDFSDPIEIFYYSVNTPSVLIGRNNDEAKVYGFEIELRKNLLENDNSRLSFNLNSSLIVSELKMSEEEYLGRVINDPDRQIKDSRELQGQSPFLVNFGINYNNIGNGFDSGLYYNVQGRSLQVIGVGSLPDVYTEPFNSLNLNLSKNFGLNKNKRLSLKVDNILNDVMESKFDYFGNTDFLFSRLEPGVRVSLGYSIKF